MDASMEQKILERLARIEARLEERCAISSRRLEAVEKGLVSLREAAEASFVRQGERIGKLEIIEHKRAGGMTVMLAMLGAAGTLGGLVVKFLPAIGGM